MRVVKRLTGIETDVACAVGEKNQKPVTPASVERYLRSKFSDSLPVVRSVMHKLAKSRTPEQLAEEAFRLYEAFRPGVPAGETGWGAKGTLSISRIARLARQDK